MDHSRPATKPHVTHEVIAEANKSATQRPIIKNVVKLQGPRQQLTPQPQSTKHNRPKQKGGNRNWPAKQQGYVNKPPQDQKNTTSWAGGTEQGPNCLLPARVNGDKVASNFSNQPRLIYSKQGRDFQQQVFKARDTEVGYTDTTFDTKHIPTPPSDLLSGPAVTYTRELNLTKGDWVSDTIESLTENNTHGEVRLLSISYCFGNYRNRLELVKLCENLRILKIHFQVNLNGTVKTPFMYPDFNDTGLPDSRAILITGLVELAQYRPLTSFKVAYDYGERYLRDVGTKTWAYDEVEEVKTDPKELRDWLEGVRPSAFPGFHPTDGMDFMVRLDFAEHGISDQEEV